MPYYRKKPIPVEARPFTGDNFQELQDWSNDLVALSDYNEDVLCVHTLEPVSPMLSKDFDCWEPDDGVSNRIRIKALNTLVATGEVEIECEEVD